MLPGRGKSKALRKWAKKHGYKVEKFKIKKHKPADLLGYVHRTDGDRIEWPTPRSFMEVSELLKQPRGLTFLDEYGQASKKVRRAFAKLLKKGKL